MPPVMKAGSGSFRKDVEFVSKDDEEQIATGIVMVPHKVDLQGDWERPETIQEFAEQFADFEEVGQAGGGVMHAAFPDEHLDLVENAVLEEAQTIGGKEVPEGAWRQDWKVHDEQLWDLIGDVLEGYSIGADAVRWNGPMDQDDLPEEVSVPDEIDEDEYVWELTEGIVQEVSAVDIPAVPDAQILETKSAYEKRLSDHLGNRDGFIEEAIQRGHSEEEAERLWDYLNDAADLEGAGKPGEKSRFADIGRAVVDTVFGTDDGGNAKASPEDPDRGAAVADTPDVDPRERFKEGRTLSTSNRESLFATIDASLDVLNDAGVDELPKRFTDRDDVDFDLSEHDAREWAGDHDEENEEEEDGSPIDNAAGGDTPDDEGGTEAADDMPDTDTNTTDDGDETEADADEAKAIAEQNAEQISELTAAVESLTETLTGPEPDTTEIELNGETYEVPESQVKAALGVDEDAGSEDIANAIESLKDDVDEQAARLDALSRQSGRGSQQLDQAADENGDGKESGLNQLGEALGGGA